MKQLNRIYCIGRNEKTQELYRFLILSKLDVLLFSDLKDFKQIYSKKKPDSIILNLDITCRDRIRELRELRKGFQLPIIITGNINSFSGQSEIFNTGADDFMSSQEEPAIILARLQAVWTRISRKESTEILKVIDLKEGRLILNGATHQARLNNRDLGLTMREWKVFLYLITHSGRAVSREELLENTLDYQYGGYNRILDTYIRNIRKKLAVPDCIKTLRGYGYRFEPPGPAQTEIHQELIYSREYSA